MEKPQPRRIKADGGGGTKADEECGNQDTLRKFQIQMSTGEKHRAEN